MFFTPRYVKEARHFIEAARRVLRYRIDQLTRAEYDEVDQKIESLVKATKARDPKAVEKATGELEKTTGRITPARSHPGWRENCEVLLVAVVIAAGVRAYIVEPFKIPTGSMQPTLNGVIAHSSDSPAPNFIVRALEFVLRGRTFVDVVGKENDVVRGLNERSYLNYFSFTDVICGKSKYTIFAPANVVAYQMGIRPGLPVRKDRPLFRGWVDNGDFVLVNKLAYNFAFPKRGDVFVFRTTGISGIEDAPDFPKDLGSQHYIKRLAGLPGDTLRIDPPDLYVNGKLADRNAFKRVMSRENGYGGYTHTGESYLMTSDATVTIPAHFFFALGDNSANSRDSRSWGFVPEDNVTGKAFVVFWPFTKRWGFID